MSSGAEAKFNKWLGIEVKRGRVSAKTLETKKIGNEALKKLQSSMRTKIAMQKLKKKKKTFKIKY